MHSKNLSPKNPRDHSIVKTKRSLISKLIASALIVFSIVLVSAAIVYAGSGTWVTWPSGSAPEAAPGAGNVQLAAITNAITICPDDQFLQGDGSCLTAAQIVAAAGVSAQGCNWVDWKYSPEVVASADVTCDSGNFSCTTYLKTGLYCSSGAVTDVTMSSRVEKTFLGS
jgi:hypothetical protein